MAEEWDNVGLQAGDPSKPVARVMIALDVSMALLDAALHAGVDMLVTHHPLIFTPFKKLDLSQPLPRIISILLKNDIALASAHTNLDSAENGVSDQLARIAGLVELRPMIPASEGAKAGIGRAGRFEEPLSLQEIAARLCQGLNLPAVMVAGEPSMRIATAAVCGGSGSSLWSEFLATGCDLYVTAEVKHSVLREAELLGKAVIDAGHFATEWPVVPVVADYLKRRAAEREWSLEVLHFEQERPPFVWMQES